MTLLFTYLTNCINCPGLEGMTYAEAGQAIQAMQDIPKGITRRTFLRHVAEQFGYARHPFQGLTMAKDWMVHYYKSTFRGRPCYYFDHSRIEYIFTQAG